MSNADKYKTPSPVKSKLFNLKEWLTIPEAAKYLSAIFGEEVCESDILRLALDGHLKLSINFVNHASAKFYGKFLPFKEWEEGFRSEFSKEERCALPDSTISAIHAIIEYTHNISKKYDGLVPPSTGSSEEKVRSINGVCDLPMIGGEEIYIENEYQRMTGGPVVELISIDGSFVEYHNGEIWQLQEKFDEKFLEDMYGEEGKRNRIEYYAECLNKKIENNEITVEESVELLEERKRNINKKRSHSDDYYPACGLPADGVLVVRTSALLDLQERISEEQAESKPASPKTEKSNLHIIGALLQIVMDEKLFPSEAALREHIAQQYQGYPGCAERTLAGRFAEAKKMLLE